MTQSDLIQSISSRGGLSKAHATSFLKAFISSVNEALERGESVSFVGFGRFSVLERQERNGVNPRTQQPMRIPSMRSVVFRPGLALRRKVKG